MRDATQNTSEQEATSQPLARRSFLKMSGAAVATGVMIGGLDISQAFAARGARYSGPVHLGDGDIGIMNYAYALEQLEARFYSIIVSHPYRGGTARERNVMADLRDHEVAHREFFRRILGPNRILDLAFDFSSVDFRNRASVLTTARNFEDLGVAAYNGAGKLIESSRLLAAAGRIVSVEGRHAAIIRDMIEPLTSYFAGNDVVDALGLDRSWSPRRVLRHAQPYIVPRIDGSDVG